MFTLDNVKFKDILAIDKLKIPSSKISCIIGPSGAGKSTLLKLLNNLLSITQGQILYQGQNLEEINPIKLRKEVIMLAQRPVVFEGTIKDNLEKIFKLREEKLPSEDKMARLLEVVHLDKSLTTKADKLSGGEKQRLALVRVLLLEPEVLLLDEPSSALDEVTEELIIKKVVDYIRENNKTLVMITHSTAIANKYGDQIIKITDGQVIKEGK